MKCLFNFLQQKIFRVGRDHTELTPHYVAIQQRDPFSMIPLQQNLKSLSYLRTLDATIHARESDICFKARSPTMSTSKFYFSVVTAVAATRLYNALHNMAAYCQKKQRRIGTIRNDCCALYLLLAR